MKHKLNLKELNVQIFHICPNSLDIETPTEIVLVYGSPTDKSGWQNIHLSVMYCMSCVRILLKPLQDAWQQVIYERFIPSDTTL